MSKRLIYTLIIVILIIISWYVFIYGNVDKNETLYDRLGGIYSIADVIDHFSDSLVTNPIVGQNSDNPVLRDWHTNKLDRLPGLKFMRTLWLCSLAGGPFKYSPTKPGKCPFSLENAHSKFMISPTEFDAVAQELSNSLDHFSVPEREENEVLAAFAMHKPEVIQGYQIANHLPITQP